ncbi:type I-E CRISPR-associated protein Cas5/CasD [Natronoglycomyces albus]|uniref:Type I-E CRISPR-associated protein Cas5/CasD n=1 Tax=Natronoglycomyces albus TaxID=2811108 RepID=A0A895XY32_9ACTN|nr:type I-E CRISPR-associated protein Cas5/CasD [Natronoglycomyces albus]QSB06528.1 type I-E CRISPR-associated protein Cas5/CasD [Natronoglycomyces albus]
MTALILRLAAPLQSWGERGTFGEKDTADFPTRSGLLGLIACAAGIKRGHSLGSLSDLDFTVRIDRPGVRIIDFHTVGGGYPRHQGIPTADGKRKNTAIITRRHYLADAVFTVACTGPRQAVDKAASAVAAPRWQPFLGRRSCPPEQPMVLGLFSDADQALQEVPLPPNPRNRKDEVQVNIIRTAPAGSTEAWSEMYDHCDGFPVGDRFYRSRPILRTTEILEPRQRTHTTEEYLDRLTELMRRGEA